MLLIITRLLTDDSGDLCFTDFNSFLNVNRALDVLRQAVSENLFNYFLSGLELESYGLVIGKKEETTNNGKGKTRKHTNKQVSKRENIAFASSSPLSCQKQRKIVKTCRLFLKESVV
jgi:hypothetical protein